MAAVAGLVPWAESGMRIFFRGSPRFSSSARINRMPVSSPCAPAPGCRVTESMTTVTEELWFTDWDFGGAPWTAKAKEQFAKWSPHLHADRITTPTLVITNERDFRVPVDQGLQLFTALRRQGVPSEALVFPDEGHFVLKPLNSKRWHEAVFGWMKKWLER